MSRRPSFKSPSEKLKRLQSAHDRLLSSLPPESYRTPIQLLVIASYLNRLNFIETINAHVNWDEKQWKFSPGVLAQLLVLLPFTSTLKKIPLSRIHEQYSGMDLEPLVGEPINPEELNDDLFARLLDRIYDSGCSELFLSVALSVRATFDLPDNLIFHSDTTSHVLYGDYLSEEDESPPISITYGYSKQKRRDLKQVMTGMVTDGDGLPLYCCTLDGNKADCTYNNEMLEILRTIYGSELSQYVYIADSKLLNKPNFLSITQGEHPIRFITKTPENFYQSLAKKTRTRAFESGEWTALGQCSTHPNPSNPPEYSVYTQPVTIYGHPCYIHLFQTSDGEKKTQRAIEKSTSELNDELKSLLKKEFACEPDAKAEIDRFLAARSSELVYADLSVEKKETIRRARGRPSKNPKPPVVEITWKVVSLGSKINEERVEAFKRKASTFALLTNVPPEELSAREILLQYKGQNKVEHNFKLLKEPTVAATIFLEKPERIMALMTILYFSVLMHAIVRVITHTELQNFEEPPRINSNNRPLVRPNSDTIIWLLSLFNLVEEGDGFYIESKMAGRKDDIRVLLQITRFDFKYIGN